MFESAVAAPRQAEGRAIDPIALGPVDEVVVTILVDNSYDALLADTGPARRARVGRIPQVAAAQFEQGVTMPGLVAEHGFSALVIVWRADSIHTLLFDTGISPDGLATNIERLGSDVGMIEAVVLGHGHFDHAGGFPGLIRLRGRRGLPLTLHPLVWTRRRLSLPGMAPFELPTLSRAAIESEGFTVVERRHPSILLDGMVLVTGEVDRTTDFELGMPFHERFTGNGWAPDPEIVDDQALILNLHGRGLVVLTGCGHAGAVNICRHALRLTGIDQLHALLGGFHLTGAAFEPIIELNRPTVPWTPSRR